MSNTRIWSPSLVTAGAVLAASAGWLACGSAPPATVHHRQFDQGGDLSIGFGSEHDCPSLTDFALGPQALEVGGTATLMAAGKTADGGAPQYFWSATGGHVADPTGATTTFLCTSPGDVTVTVTIDDDGCRESTSGGISCSATDGGGVSASDASDAGAGGD